MLEDRIAFFTADTTAETVFSNVSGQVTRVTKVTCANPSTGGATTVRLTIGADGATTRWFFAVIPAGEGFYAFDVEQTYEGTETMQAASSSTDDVVVVTVNGYRKLVS